MEFNAQTKPGFDPVPIEWPSDLAVLHRLNPSRYPCLLESVAEGSDLGRYDLLFACPQASLRLNPDFSLTGPDHVSAADNQFLETFDRWFAQEAVPHAAHAELPFSGGWFLVLGYELARQIEPTLELGTRSDGPVAIAIRIPVAVIRDRREQKAWIVAEEDHEAEVAQIGRDLEILRATPGREPAPNIGLLEDELAEDDPQTFLDAIARAQRYIEAGDIFQANLSRQWHGKLKPGMQPVDVYERLRAFNPAPFAGLALFDGFAVISSSPERLLRMSADRIETRPIAGTRPRPSPGHGEAPLRTELLENPKERAEHIMVIDLERNDLGRICSPGSVIVDEFMVIESYAHVHHIVSNISGRPVAGASPGDMIAAIFPGGSITGCPKVRCMEIIDELEGRPRGVYTGAMGYINRDGSGDLSILIRCMTLHGRELSFATGCGIVTDSDSGQELAETRAKAKGLILALTGDR